MKRKHCRRMAALFAAVMLLSAFPAAAEQAYTTYTSEALRLSFQVDAGYSVTERDGYIWVYPGETASNFRLTWAEEGDVNKEDFFAQTGEALRAAMGAVFRLPLYTVGLEDLPRLLADAGLPLYGTALRHDTVDVRQRDLRRCALVIGSEGRGVSAEVLALCRETLRIPMSSHCESLNAAAAAAVLLWEAYRAEEGN